MSTETKEIGKEINKEKLKALELTMEIGRASCRERV